MEHLRAPRPAIGKGHIPKPDAAAVQIRLLLRLRELGQVQQLPGVLHRKLHTLHGVDECGSSHERGDDAQGHHQAERHLSWVQHPGLVKIDAHREGPQQGGGQDGQAQIHGGPGAAEPVQGKVPERAHSLGELGVGSLPLAEGLDHLDALHIFHDDAVDMVVGRHIGGIVLVVGPHSRRHGDQGHWDGHQQGQSHPPVDGEHGDDDRQGQKQVRAQLWDHVGQGRLHILDAVHDGALHGPDGPGFHLAQGRPHELICHLEAKALQNGIGGYMGQHGGQGIARHLDGVACQAHPTPQQDALQARPTLHKQPQDLIDSQIRHKASCHADHRQGHRGGHFAPAGSGIGEQDAQPGPFFHRQDSSQKK